MAGKKKQRPANGRALKRYASDGRQKTNRIKALKKRFAEFPNNKVLYDTIDKVESMTPDESYRRHYKGSKRRPGLRLAPSEKYIQGLEGTFKRKVRHHESFEMKKAHFPVPGDFAQQMMKLFPSRKPKIIRKRRRKWQNKPTSV